MCERKQRRHAGSQRCCSTGNTGTGSQPLTPSPYSLPLFLVYGWLPDVRSARQTDWFWVAQALLLQTQSTDVAMVEIQFVAAFVCSAAALLFFSQEQPSGNSNSRDFSAQVLARTKSNYSGFDDRSDRLCFLFKYLHLDQLLQY